jgi:hypothetical protein
MAIHTYLAPSSRLLRFCNLAPDSDQLDPFSLAISLNTSLPDIRLHGRRYVPPAAVLGLGIVMALSSPDIGVIAGACTAAGAVILKVFEKLFFSPKDQAQEARSFRQELRQEVQDLRQRTREVEREVIAWRSASFALIDYAIQIRSRLIMAEDQINELRVDAGKPSVQHPPIPPMPVVILDGQLQQERRHEERDEHELEGPQ